MIYPSIHNYTARYRGPKEMKELEKYIASLRYNINLGKKTIDANSKVLLDKWLEIVYNEEEDSTQTLSKDGNLIATRESGVASLANRLNQAESVVQQILKNI